MVAGKEALAAAAVLAPLYEQAGEWRKLIASHEVEIGQADDAIARMAATMSAQAKADLARMDAEDAAEVCS